MFSTPKQETNVNPCHPPIKTMYKLYSQPYFLVLLLTFVQ